MNLSIIVALDQKNGIGKNNDLLCHLPNDLKWFKKNTSGSKVIMGRNTFLSLPNGALPKRENIVLSNVIEHFENCTVFNTIDEVLKNLDNDKENFIIGGASVYEQFLKYANKLYLTKIHHSFEADVYFPEINYEEWMLIEKTDNQKDEKHFYDYDFEVYIRK